MGLSEIGEAFCQNPDQLMMGLQGLCHRAIRETYVAQGMDMLFRLSDPPPNALWRVLPQT